MALGCSGLPAVSLSAKSTSSPLLKLGSSAIILLKIPGLTLLHYGKLCLLRVMADCRGTTQHRGVQSFRVVDTWTKSIQQRDLTSPKNKFMQPLLLQFSAPSTGSGSVVVCVYIESAGRVKSRDFGHDGFQKSGLLVVEPSCNTGEQAPSQ